MNRVTARIELCNKIEADRQRVQLARAAAVSKRRAQNRKRSSGEKAKMVKDKRQRSNVKTTRKRPGKED